MASPDVAVSKPFEVQGVWWTPEREDGYGDQVAGTLTYAPDSGFRLTLLDWHRAAEPPQRLEVIHGEALGGRPCTLFDALSSHWEMGFGGAGSGHTYEEWHCNSLFYGVHIGEREALHFDRATLRLRGLREWLAQPWRGLDQEGGNSGLGGPEGEQLEVALPGARLTLSIGPTAHTRRFETTHRVSALATFQFDEQIGLQEFRERYSGPLEDLLILGTREETVVESTRVSFERPDAHDEPWWSPAGGPQGPPPKTVEIVERTRLHWPSREPSYRRLLLYPAALGDDAPATLHRWFELRGRLGGAGNVLFGVLNSRSLNLENKLLNLTAFAEAYHRIFYDEPLLSRAVHRRLMRAMLAAIEKEHRSLYRDRLSHAREQTQHTRITGLVERAATALEFAGAWTTLPRQLVDTRNYLTHWSRKSEHVVEGEQLLEAIQRLTVVLQVNLMLDLSVPQERIEHAIRQSYVWEGVLEA